MRRPIRAAATEPTLVVLVGLVALLGRQVWAAEPTMSECLASYEDSINLKRDHQLRGALAKFAVCSSESCPPDVRRECLRLAPEVQAAMPTVVFEASDAAGANLSAVKVTMDGNVLAERLDGTALPIDPGEHTFAFEVAGRAPVEKRLTIWEGDKLRHERLEFAALAPPKPAVPPPAAVTKSILDQPQPRQEAKPSWSKTRIVGVVLGGIGVAATGVGVAYGFIAMSRRNQANDVCPATCTDSTQADLWNGAYSAGTVATGALIVGAVGIASGVVIWLRTKSAADGAPGARVGLGPGGLQLRGRW